MKITTALAVAVAVAICAPSAQAQPGSAGHHEPRLHRRHHRGGLLGNQVGGGSGKTIATAADSLMGCGAGQAIQDQRQA
jgi:hypothetical protein